MSQAVSYALFPVKTLKNSDFVLIFQRDHKETCHSNVILHKIRPIIIFLKVLPIVCSYLLQKKAENDMSLMSKPLKATQPA